MGKKKKAYENTLCGDWSFSNTGTGVNNASIPTEMTKYVEKSVK